MKISKKKWEEGEQWPWSVALRWWKKRATSSHLVSSGLFCFLQLPLPKKQIKIRFKGEKERRREHYKSGKEEENQIVERERERDGGWWWWRIWEAMVVVTNDDGWERWRWWWWRVNERWWWWWRAEGEMVVVVRRSNVMDWTRRGVTERERFACVFFWSNEICVLG